MVDKIKMDIKNLYQNYLKASKVSTDTRNITVGSIFFALKGDRFNANEFAKEALEKGASCAVVDEEKYATDDRFILVDNTLKALQQLARYHRDQLTIPVIGLTGSNGKTTSKELLNAVLSTSYKTLATRGNLNNHIGVPLTVLSIDSSVEIAIIEMGANHMGEIADLCAIANPTHGFITNIGKAHIGTFGSFDNIIRGKSELYMHLIENEGVVFINSDNYILSNMSKRFKNPIFYPRHGDYYHCELMQADPYVKIKTELGVEVQTQLIGKYNFENIAVALCIGKYFKVDPNQASEAVSQYVPANMRSQVIQKGTNTIILDAYNANPTSMAEALTSFAEMRADRKVLILGDMFELEDEAEKEHRVLGKLIRDLGFNEVYVCGALSKSVLDEFPVAKHFNAVSELMAVLKTDPINQATILIKASRGIRLETVVDAL